MATIDLDPAPGRDPEALIKEARRRQRRRYLAVGLAGLVVVVAIAGSLLSGGRPLTAGERGATARVWQPANAAGQASSARAANPGWY